MKLKSNIIGQIVTFKKEIRYEILYHKPATTK
jgi:hypothetical protein